jgi:hypothetical protein
MNTRKAFITAGLVLASLIMLPVAHADEWDQASQLTFSQSVQIPGRVLPAGTYWFVLADTVGSRNIIQVFNSDRSTLYATVLAVTAERPHPSDNTTITFAKRESMPTNAIVTWFYPGRNSGHEFVYSKSEEKELARAKHHTIMATAPVKTQTTASGD